MQGIAAFRRSVQNCSGMNPSNLTVKTSPVTESESFGSDPDLYMDELRASLENRKPTKELYQVSDMIDEREKEIEEKDKLILELQEQKKLQAIMEVTG